MAAISLVVSDVDGTLVTSDKRLTPATLDAVRRLGQAGIAFTVASSRPPVGLAMLVEPLRLKLPMGAFNGSTVVSPDLTVVEEHLIPADAAREAVDRLIASGADVWVFAEGQWLLRDPAGAYTDRERRTLLHEPTVVADLGPHLDRAAKIVGVSADFPLLAAQEAEIAAALGDGASVHRSQRYYLDVTPPGVDKGSLVDALARALGIGPEGIVTLGDMANDIALFRRSGFPIAMGNADEHVRAAAKAVTRTNDEDGFAAAIDAYVLGG